MPPEQERLTVDELREIWPILSPEERMEGFRLLPSKDAGEYFLTLGTASQAGLVENLPPSERKLWIGLLPPDDVADLVQELPPEVRPQVLGLLDDVARREVAALMAYAEDDAGGLMSPRFARIRADMTVDEAIAYLRRQARANLETIYYAYVLDAEQKLVGVVSFRELFAAPGTKPVREVMQSQVVSVPETQDQEETARIIAREDLMAVPVVDDQGRMKGIITVDDIVDVVQEEATEDIQKLGGLSALDTPYLQTGFRAMVKKRAGWLCVLFLGEILTASAMGRYEQELTHTLVLALFVPLIISSGGNSGSQASTLIIRAMALGQVRLRDWWPVLRREVVSGLALGVILAALGFLRIVLWESLFDAYGPDHLLLGATVACALVGVVLWGTVTGATLPFLLRALRLDPASASAPFVATLVDVFGLVIYFNVARALLAGARF